MVRHDRTLTFELKSADKDKEMKSVHMAKDKGSKGARFESGHHKSFVFKAAGFDALEDWVSALQQHAVAVQRPSTQVPAVTPDGYTWCRQEDSVKRARGVTCRGAPSSGMVRAERGLATQRAACSQLEVCLVRLSVPLAFAPSVPANAPPAPALRAGARVEEGFTSAHEVHVERCVGSAADRVPSGATVDALHGVECALAECPLLTAGRRAERRQHLPDLSRVTHGCVLRRTPKCRELGRVGRREHT